MPASTRTEAGRQLPLWLRAMRSLHARLPRARPVLEPLMEALAIALIRQEQRDAITQAIYATASGYRVGGSTFDGGPFQWELDALSDPGFPRDGRVLLGGAGGGREIRMLAERGYAVVAFEPAGALVDSALRVAATYAGMEVYRGSYDDLVDAVMRRSGPLVAVADRQFDACIVGWGSFSHILTVDARISVLTAVRTLSPAGPVLVSYLPGEAGENGERSRARSLPAVLSRTVEAKVIRFRPWLGFYRLTGDAELDAIARAAGYRVRWLRRSPYAHALLVVADPSEASPLVSDGHRTKPDKTGYISA